MAPTEPTSVETRSATTGDEDKRLRHYGKFQVARLIDHAAQKLVSDVDSHVKIVHERLLRDQKRIEDLLGGELRDRKVLVVGPGQMMNELRYLATGNQATGIDIDILTDGWNPIDFLRMWKQNGAGRVIKTIARRVLGIDRRWRNAWCRSLGVPRMPSPQVMLGDICDGAPERNHYDLVGSWSVFQHLPDPGAALSQMVDALRPGGVLCVGIHLYTSFTGSCDHRAITGGVDQLPAWGHLRPSTKDQIQPSAYLNQLRLEQWREIFEAHAPGFEEFREDYGVQENRVDKLPAEVRDELSDFSDEELSTVDLYFMWKKPRATLGASAAQGAHVRGAVNFDETTADRSAPKS